ncbi:hypothetical protein A6769_34705 [Nostoc punctiforme NIES-2108]|uniref:Uncharacterized protein n=1 Tax=Nostoc punctiforme NIES-2108 TaxID=1356359 RepID=A0A367R3B1_NOSPU|nr:hypothetical protein A6769_34705 [Nostoc punctiforme NIES-2108]
MKRDLPNWLQSLLTNLSAKPYYNEKPRQQTVLNHVWTTFLALIVGVYISTFSVIKSDFYLLLLPLG